MHNSEGMAMVIAWPETTARGDDRWYSVLKRLGLVKNLNFKVGHAAIILIHKPGGILYYYDFGRYITPRGNGRARSADTDPKLMLNTKANISNGMITNLQEILLEMDLKKEATHGMGAMYFSITDHIDFRKAKTEADKWVLIGSTPYGALAKNNNSCSRYVWQIFKAGITPDTPQKWTSVLPHETLFPSPISNVINASKSRDLFIFRDMTLTQRKMNRWQSLGYFISQVSHSFQSSKSKHLPDDSRLGFIKEPLRPLQIPQKAQWLGGIGEGAWYDIEIEKDYCTIRRFNHKGEEEYQKKSSALELPSVIKSYKFTYDCHYLFTTIALENKVIRLQKVKNEELILQDIKSI